LSLADVRLKMFIEMETDLRAQFLELLGLRERLRQAEFTAELQKNKAKARKPAPVAIAEVA
jgi:hypothetical protein